MVCKLEAIMPLVVFISAEEGGRGLYPTTFFFSLTMLLTLSHYESPGINVGTNLSSVVPSPSWPVLL